MSVCVVYAAFLGGGKFRESSHAAGTVETSPASLLRPVQGAQASALLSRPWPGPHWGFVPGGLIMDSVKTPHRKHKDRKHESLQLCPRI